MRLQDMPILDRMYPGGDYIVIGESGNTARSVSPDLFRYLADFKRFKLPNGMSIPKPDATEWNPSSIFGHLVLPFPKVWVEWETKNETQHAPLIMAAACINVDEVGDFLPLVLPHVSEKDLTAISHAKSGQYSRSWAMFLFHLNPGIPVMIPGSLRVYNDTGGMYAGIAGAGASFLGQGSETKAATLTSMGWDALAAIGWLNCKNVSTTEHDRSKNVKRRRPNKNKATSLSFYTINLPGSPSGASSGAGKKTGTTALHMARGHFKTFTEDAPLMGKHVGTYWWGWQVRGNPERGATVTDYKISA